MKILAFTSVLLFTAFFAVQSQPIEVSGKVASADSLEPLPFVHILINRNVRDGATTDQHGRFSLRINKSDTLYFSSVGYHPGKATFSDSTGASFSNLTILLQPRTFQLKPVEVFAYDLEEILNKKKEENLSLQKNDPQPLFEPKEKEDKPAIGFGVSPEGGASLEGAVTAFANLFNREFKERKKLQELLAAERLAARREEQKRLLIQNYRQIASQAIRLDSAAFENFMELYLPREDFLSNANDYQLTLRILRDYQDYRMRFQLEEVSLDELLENARFRD